METKSKEDIFFAKVETILKRNTSTVIPGVLFMVTYENDDNLILRKIKEEIVLLDLPYKTDTRVAGTFFGKKKIEKKVQFIIRDDLTHIIKDFCRYLSLDYDKKEILYIKELV